MTENFQMIKKGNSLPSFTDVYNKNLEKISDDIKTLSAQLEQLTKTQSKVLDHLLINNEEDEQAPTSGLSKLPKKYYSLKDIAYWFGRSYHSVYNALFCGDSGLCGRDTLTNRNQKRVYSLAEVKTLVNLLIAHKGWRLDPSRLETYLTA